MVTSATGTMSAVMCQNFVQNAWKHEFCTNCYRTKHEHPRLTYVPSSTTWQGLALQKKKEHQQKPPESAYPVSSCPPPLAGILKGGRRSRPPFHQRQIGSVGFHDESPQIIGYGGHNIDDEWGNDQESFGTSAEGSSATDGIMERNGGLFQEDGVSSEEGNVDGDSLENFDLSLEEKVIAQMTVKNTEFNSNLKNLARSPDAKTDSECVAAEGNSSASSSEHQPISVEAGAASSSLSCDETAPACVAPTSEAQTCVALSFVASLCEEAPACETETSRIGEPQEAEASQQVPVDGEPLVIQNNSSSSRCCSPITDGIVSPPDCDDEPQKNCQPTSAEPSGVLPKPSDSPEAHLEETHLDDKRQESAMHYSSSSILKGLNISPVSQRSVPFSCSSSNETSPVSTPTGIASGMSRGKEKPKVPTKPSNLSLTGSGTSINGSQSSPTNDTIPQDQNVKNSTLVSMDPQSDLSFQAKVATIASSLDLNKRNVKRQAPLPPATQGADSVQVQPKTARGTLVLPIGAAHRPLQAWESDPGPSSPVSSDKTNVLSQPTRVAPTSPCKKSPTLPLNSSLSGPCCGLRTKSPSLDSGAGRFPCLSTHDYMKDVKKFKSRFSLKKFLKFGRDGEDGRSRTSSGNGPTCGNGSMRAKSRIEILHPIDLANLSNEPRKHNISDGYNVPNCDKLNTHAVVEKQSSDTDQGDYSYIQPTIGDIPSPQGEYANLGDARTPFVPKKPERNSPASCRRDTLSADHSKSVDGSQYEVIGSSDENPETKVCDRTYYEPAEVGMASTHWESPLITNNDSSQPRRTKSKHRPAGIVWATSEDDSGDAGSEGSLENGVAVQIPRAEPASLSALYAKVHKAKHVVSSDLRSSSPNDPLSSSLSEDEPPGTPPAIQCNHRLQLRKGRTVLPRGLHENYGAVVAANHEALAQLLDQISQRRALPCGISATFKDATLRWADFKVDSENPLGSLEHVSFYAATWRNDVPVTLMVTDELFPAPCSTRNPFVICPVATFQDWVPAPPKNTCLQRSWVGVMDTQKLLPLSAFVDELRSTIADNAELFERGVAIVLLQFLSALKHLQADGIEEVADDLSWVLICKDDPFQFDWRLMLVPLEQADALRISLCECAMRMVLYLLSDSLQDIPEVLPNRTAFLGILELLRTEKATSLSNAKAAVEFFLWGPAGLVTIDAADCQEVSFQHWLDLERATTLSTLIRSQQNHINDFSPVEELRLTFLVRATARTLKAAATVVASSASTA